MDNETIKETVEEVGPNQGKRIYQNERNCEVISFYQLPEDIQDYFKIGKFFDSDNLLCSLHDDTYEIKMFTSDHVYTIFIKHDYISGFVSDRKSRPGELWVRGNDLPDGDRNFDTFMEIMFSIVKYELEEIKI